MPVGAGVAGVTLLLSVLQSGITTMIATAQARAVRTKVMPFSLVRIFMGETPAECGTWDFM